MDRGLTVQHIDIGRAPMEDGPLPSQSTLLPRHLLSLRVQSRMHVRLHMEKFLLREAFAHEVSRGLYQSYKQGRLITGWTTRVWKHLQKNWNVLSFYLTLTTLGQSFLSLCVCVVRVSADPDF